MTLPRQLTLIALAAATAAGGTLMIKGLPTRLLFCDPATLQADEVCLSQLSHIPDLVWVDARPRKDWEKTGINGSLLWNLDPTEDMLAFEAQAATAIAGHSRVVVYCSDEQCGVSRQVAERIRQMDLGVEISVLRGGWRALDEARLTKNHQTP